MISSIKNYLKIKNWKLKIISAIFLLVHKPPGPSSHDVINRLRHLTGEKRVGHAGTLDPFAEGLLLCAIGRESTKQLNRLLKLDKTYEATLRLGAVSNTYDLTGKITKINPKLRITDYGLQQVLSSFLGPSLQTPPIFSAKKINGQKAYKLARQNKPVALKPQPINIFNLELKKSRVTDYVLRFMGYVLRITGYELRITVHCSSGTYIRSLARDIGEKLGTGAYLTKLKRTSIGPFSLKNAVKLTRLTPANWQKFTFSSLPDLPDKTIVLAFGTFDLLHPGHKYFLEQARTLGDELHVVIARDQNVLAIKNKLPRDDEQTRLRNVKSLPCVTAAHLGQLDISKRYRLIGKIKPAIIALGYDQRVDENKLQAKLHHYHLHNTRIIRLKAYHPDKYKTSILRLSAA